MEDEIWGWSRLFPTLPYALGAVLGHFIAGGFHIVESFAAVIVVGLVLLAWSILVGLGKASTKLVRAHEFVSRRRYVPALLGFLVGGLFWGP